MIESTFFFTYHDAMFFTHQKYNFSVALILSCMLEELFYLPWRPFRGD